MSGESRKPTVVRVVALMALLLALIAGALPASASPPEALCFNVVASLGGGPGTWSSDGLIESSGTATFEPFVAGWDPELGIPATVHDRFVMTDEQGSITIQAQGKSALVTNDNGGLVPGYMINWAIITGSGAYADLHGQGAGYAWPDFASGTFPVHQCGQGHYDPQP